MPEVSGGDTRPEPVLKKVDAWWTVLAIDPLAMWVVRRVDPIAVITPTVLTVAAHLLGIVSATLIAMGELVPAAIIFEIRFVLDCADGKLARVRGTSSVAGAYLDYVGDFYVVGASMIAISLHLHWADELPVIVVVGLPAAFFAHIAAGKSRLAEALMAGVADRPPVERLPGGYRRWMAARRLRATPSRIDVEHALLFAVPVVAVLADDPTVLAAAAWVAAVYFAYRSARLTVGGYRVARERDRSAPLIP